MTQYHIDIEYVEAMGSGTWTWVVYTVPGGEEAWQGTSEFRWTAKWWAKYRARCHARGKRQFKAGDDALAFKYWV
jgi:hypothetical protein